MSVMITTNQEIINGIEKNHPILTDKITKGISEYKNYVECLKDEKFVEIPNETEEDAIKRAESIYDRLDEIIIRNELSNKKALETIEILKKMTELFNGIVKNTEDEKGELALRNNELIDIIIDFQKIKTKKLIEKNPRRKNALKGAFKDKKEELNELKIQKKETSQKQIVQPISKQSLNNLDNDEIQLLEEWTRMKIGNIIFDSNVDNWNVKTSVFGERIINKSNLIFLIEDEDGNKFGGYINAIIENIDDWINDPKSFVFSLKSNGRLNGMMKFDIKDSRYGLFVCHPPNIFLFATGNGNDICLYKENKKNESYCFQTSFNYNGIENALCGKKNFTPKRITVAQLI